MEEVHDSCIEEKKRKKYSFGVGIGKKNWKEEKGKIMIPNSCLTAGGTEPTRSNLPR